ncbi:MAG: ATP-binding protein [Nitrospiraceae bacterium]|nr:ATP-binding protein [Nitrospiraceae bacterium]
MIKTIDITPNPRILRTLGEIPFQPWQCLAELIDNSVDAFSETVRAGTSLPDKRVSVSWSSEAVASGSRTVEVVDTGPGMVLEQLQNAARAGYSSNDPVSNLGLFGMGFNISTARLGESTRLLSATPESSEWTGIEIDFAALIGTKSYAAKVVSEPKRDPSEHGTKVVVSKLKGETYAHLRDQEAIIRRQLENIYSPLLAEIEVEIFIQGKKLSRRSHCVWGSSRYVSRDGRTIPAVIQINRDLGSALFDVERNTYLSRDEQETAREKFGSEGRYPANIIERQKRLRGWVGIQRYADPNDFGIDFIRNGRKILISNKMLFSYENPLTGAAKLEYPVELGTTVGGRIVGEVHIDYLLPTYQKNDFDRTDPSWAETVEALRGVGPILPQDRKAMGYSDPNTSPIGLLANAYRRPDPGTKCLYVDRSVAKEFAERFRRGDPDYASDDRWWQAAQEADRLNATRGAGTAAVVDAGTEASDNPDDYGPETPVTSAPAASAIVVAPVPASSTLDALMQKSREMSSWSGAYSYQTARPFQVKVWELREGSIQKNGDFVPCAFFQDGVDCDFVYNPRHQLLAQFPVEPRQLLTVYLAEKFKARDGLSDIGAVFSSIVQGRLQDLRVDKSALQEKAAGIFDRLREKLMEKLVDKKAQVLECVHESSGEVEETVLSMLSDGSLVLKFQNREDGGFEALRHVPFRTLFRLVDRFPEDLFDGKVFVAPYASLTLGDQQATERARSESKDRIISFLKDALWVGQSGTASLARGKEELSRCSHSINFLALEIVE